MSPSPPRCACGRLRPAAAERCCPRCAAGHHNTACGMRQVSLAEAAGLPVDRAFAVPGPEAAPRTDSPRRAA